MDRNAQIAKAREVDARIAAAYNEFYAARENELRIKENLASEQRLSPRFRSAEREARYEERIVEAEKLAAEKEAAYNEAEKEYEGWSRFFLVKHIHSNTHCSSFRWNTRIGWLPNVSGLTEAEAVKEHGATLCTICFPSAPVELTTKPVDDTVCPGSGKFVNRDLPNRLGYYSGNWGTCEDCGERVTVVGQSGVKLRKHKK